MRREWVDHIKSMSMEKRQQLKAQFNQMPNDAMMTVNDQRVFTIKEFMQIIESVEAGVEPEVAVSKDKLVVFRLEEGHRPDMAERIFYFATSLLVVNWVALIATTVLPYYPGSDVVHAVTMPLAFLFSGFAVAEWLLGSFFKHRKWFHAAFGWYKNGLLTARNKTMASNINKNMEAHSFIDKMLVIVGKDHVPGMKQLLIEQHGFQEILPPPPSSAAKD